MIDKFNFYDIYGYFVPGAVLLAILWTPFGLVTKTWPSADWTSAIIVVVIAYVLGHIIQSIASHAIPSNVLDSGRRMRAPSNIYLDAGSHDLPGPVKKKIGELVKTEFELDLEVDKIGKEGEITSDNDIKKIDGVRGSAFFLARQMLIQGSAVSYAEQQEGMYVLTRGLISVLILGCFYWIGWAAAACRNKIIVGGVILLLVIALLTLFNLAAIWLWNIPRPAKEQHKIELPLTLVLLVTFLALGYLLALPYHASGKQRAVFLLGAALTLIVCPPLYGSYRSFAKGFALAVWQNYLAYNVKLDLEGTSATHTITKSETRTESVTQPKPDSKTETKTETSVTTEQKTETKK